MAAPEQPVHNERSAAYPPGSFRTGRVTSPEKEGPRADNYAAGPEYKRQESLVVQGLVSRGLT